MVSEFWKRYESVLSDRFTLIVAVTGVLILIAWILELVNFPVVWASPAIATLAAIIGGSPIARWAWAGVKAREINADQLVLIALVASILGGEYIAGAVVAFIMIPASVGLAFLSKQIIHVIFEHGKFTAADTEHTAQMLIMACAGMWAVAGLRIVVQAFYAVEDMITPVWAAAVGMVVNIMVLASLPFQ